MKTSSRVVSNAFALYGAEGLGRLFNFLLFIVAVRFLEPDLYGKLQLCLILTFLASHMTDHGVQMLLMKRVAADRENAATHVMTALFCRLVLMIPAYGIIFLYLNFSAAPPVAWTFMIIIAASFLVNLPSPVIAAALHGESRMWVATGIRVPAAAIQTIIALILLLNGEGILSISWGYAAGTLVSGTGFILVGIRRGILKRALPAKPLEFLQESLPFMFRGILMFLYLRTGFFLLEHLTDSTRMGLYAAGYRLIDPFLMIPQLFAISLFPVITGFMKDRDFTAARNFCVSTMNLFLATVLPLSLILCLFSKEIILLLYGPGDYESSTPVLSILCWVLPATFLKSIFWMVIETSKHPKVAAWLTFLLLAQCILLNLFLIPRFGIPATAWIFVGTETVGVFAAIPFAIRLGLRLRWQDFPSAPFLAAAASAPILFLRTPYSLAILFVVYPLLYFLLDRQRHARKAAAILSDLFRRLPPGSRR